MQDRIKEHDREIRLAPTQTSAVSEHAYNIGHQPRSQRWIEKLSLFMFLQRTKQRANEWLIAIITVYCERYRLSLVLSKLFHAQDTQIAQKRYKQTNTQVRWLASSSRGRKQKSKLKEDRSGKSRVGKKGTNAFKNHNSAF